MLMAAVASTSPGIDIANTRSASSERTESAGATFAASFEGETPLPGKSDGLGKVEAASGPIRPMPAPESKALPANKDIAVDASVSDPETNVRAKDAGRKQGESADMTLASREIKKGIAPAARNASSHVLVGVPQSGGSSGKSSGDADADVPPKISPGQTLPVPTGSEEVPAQKLADGVTGENSLEGIGGTAALEAEAVAAAKIPFGSAPVQEVAGDKSEAPGLDKSQKASPAKGAIKDHDKPEKTERASKPASKADEMAATAPSAAGVEVQIAAYAPVAAIPLGSQQAGAETAVDAAVLSPVFSSGSGRSAKGAAATAAKDTNSKEAANSEKLDGEKAKTPEVPFAESAAVQKAAEDASKTAAAIAGDTDGDKSKTQSGAALFTDARQSHVVSGVSGAAVGDNAVGRMLPHDAGTGGHLADAITHAASSVQSGSNTPDTAVSADLAHRTLMVTPTSLEVGVSNGTHGWLKIRAEMADGGAVNTSLSTSSSSGQEMLHRELPSLTAYLQREHVAVNAIVVQPAMAGGSDLRNAFGGAGGSEQGRPPQSDGQGRQRQQDAANHAPAPAATGAAYRSVTAKDGLPSVSYAGGGSWLSVRA